MSHEFYCFYFYFDTNVFSIRETHVYMIFFIFDKQSTLLTLSLFCFDDLNLYVCGHHSYKSKIIYSNMQRTANDQTLTITINIFINLFDCNVFI